MFVVCFLIANIAIISITSKLSVEKDKEISSYKAKDRCGQMRLNEK